MTKNSKPRRKSLAQVLYESWERMRTNGRWPVEWGELSAETRKWWQAVARRAWKELRK